MVPWVAIALVGGALSATAGFFTKALLKRTTHLEDDNKQLKAQVAGLMSVVDTDQKNKEM